MDVLMARLHAFWQQRSAQERRTLGWSAAALVVLLGYQLIWMPLQDWAQREHTRLVAAQTLAGFTAKARVVLTRTTPPSMAHSQTNVPPMLWVEQAAQDMGIQQELVQRQPAGDQRVQLKFADVPFDILLRWLARAHDAGLQVVRADVTPPGHDSAKQNGRVDATLQLGRMASP